MQQILRFDRWGFPVRASEAELYSRAVLGQKTQPLKFKVQSDSVGFNISPYIALLPPNGKIVAIRVQDIERGLWFNYDGVRWDALPEVTVGGNLYIAAYAGNVGEERGSLMLQIKDDTGAVLVGKTEDVVAGGSFGVETGTINMPNRTYGITVSVTP